MNIRINLPDNPFLAENSDPIYSLRDQIHYEFTVDLTFTPRQRYRINNGSKDPGRI